MMMTAGLVRTVIAVVVTIDVSIGGTTSVRLRSPKTLVS